MQAVCCADSPRTTMSPGPQSATRQSTAPTSAASNAPLSDSQPLRVPSLPTWRAQQWKAQARSSQQNESGSHASVRLDGGGLGPSQQLCP